MTFFSVLLALIAEQLRALSPRNPVATLLRQHAIDVDHRFEAGRSRHDVLAWLAVVLPWTLVTALVYFLFLKVSIVLAFAFNVLVLYFTLGFRQFSHYFTDIHLALGNDDVGGAREVLRQWSGIDTVDMPVSEIVRHTLVHAVIESHRYVFGVFFWFLIPIGPAGAVLYRVAEQLARRAETPFDIGDGTLRPFALRAFHVIDWLPVRLTALGFAIVGNFEEAIHAWRQTAHRWSDHNDEVLLAAGSGALGARLASPRAEPIGADALGSPEAEPLPVGDECTPRTLQSAIGLVWRAVVLWMILLLMLTAAVWVG
ncbi:MAG: CobD/CbiB family protein [Janthinobacterium lividum]